MFVVERVQRLAGAAKKLPLPEGTWAIGAGLVVVGLSAYGFQILAAKRLSDSDFTSLNVLWAMVFAVSARRVRGEGGGPLVKRAALLGGLLALAVIAIAAIAHQTIIDKLFDGRG